MFLLNGKPLPLHVAFTVEREPTIIEHPDERIEREVTIIDGYDAKGDPITRVETQVEVIPGWTETINNDVQMPANWLALATPQERAALGITEVPDPVRPDDELYFVSQEEDGSFTATEKPMERLRALWRSRLAARRWAAEEKGIEINGAFFASDGASQGKLTGAALAAVIDSNYTVQWKTGAGFITLTATQIIAAAQAVRAHVQACFDHEAEVAAEIDAADTLAELQAIDVSAGWPG